MGESQTLNIMVSLQQGVQVGRTCLVGTSTANNACTDATAPYYMYGTRRGGREHLDASPTLALHVW